MSYSRNKSTDVPTIEKWNSDLHHIINDYVEDLEISTSCEIDLIEYCTLILSNIYDSKYVFEPYIRQKCWEYNTNLVNQSNYHIMTHEERIIQLEKLKLIPLIEQRTKEWHTLKVNSIGASEVSILFERGGGYGTRNQTIMKKCGHKDPPMKTNIYCQHGIKFERVVQLIYMHKYNTHIYEFGSITHPEYSYISASPDGITDKGIMIEIKVPYSREITGIPPIQYWFQMQQQLQVCNLDRVDFVECKITEYSSYNEMLTDCTRSETNDVLMWSATEQYKGVIIECSWKDPIDSHNVTTYVYPPSIHTTLEDAKSWMRQERENLQSSSDKHFQRFIFWKCNTFSNIPIYRDTTWWNNALPTYTEFWTDVQKYKEIGYESLLPKKRKSNKIDDTVDISEHIDHCIILTDDEE